MFKGCKIGLKDIDGKDIKEGDVVESLGFIQKPTEIVKYDIEVLGFSPFVYSLDERYNGYFGLYNKFKVIGSIYNK